MHFPVIRACFYVLSARRNQTCPKQQRAVIVAPMFTTLSETQRAAVTILVFFVTFFFTLSIGRLLKRRAGVRLGMLFQLFCVTAAFYAAVWAYGFRCNCGITSPRCSF